MKFYDIGIDSSLDWNRIRKLFIIGLIGGIMTFVGDWLLGYGVYDESLSGLEKKLSQYLILSDGTLFWSAFLGLIGISLEGLCYFGIYRIIASGSMKHAHTEEKWLRKLYGQEYEDYCKRVNRCIPWKRK